MAAFRFHLPFSQQFLQGFCRLVGRINQSHIVAHKIFDRILKQRIVSTSKDQGIDLILVKLPQISGYHIFCDPVVDQSLFHERHEQRTGFCHHCYIRIQFP